MQVNAEEKWNKKHVQRVPAAYEKAFPEDLGDCLLCRKRKAPIMSVQNINPNDPRLPPWSAGTNVLFGFSLCETCYDLPDVENLVETAIAGLKEVV